MCELCETLLLINVKMKTSNTLGAAHKKFALKKIKALQFRNDLLYHIS